MTPPQGRNGADGGHRGDPDQQGDPDSSRSGGPPERTALSWQRSLASVALVGTFVAGAAIRLEVGWVAAGAGVVALAAVVVAVLGRPREVRDGREETPPWPWLPRIVVATAVVGLLGAALGVLEVVRALR